MIHIHGCNSWNETDARRYFMGDGRAASYGVDSWNPPQVRKEMGERDGEEEMGKRDGERGETELSGGTEKGDFFSVLEQRLTLSLNCMVELHLHTCSTPWSTTNH